ncbi:MAG: SET domain-containing protein [Anaerolineaceae bacterium]|nr:SET domain-containing protein [Anaerolineaceae bacterium]
MLLIRTEIRPSKIHGLGCFSIEKVKKGQIIWVFDPRIDTRFEVSEMYNLHDVAKEFVMIYGYQEIINGKRIITFCGDNAKYVNHSETPNGITSPENYELEIAGMDINIGEEITSNYRSYDLTFNKRFLDH